MPEHIRCDRDHIGLPIPGFLYSHCNGAEGFRWGECGETGFSIFILDSSVDGFIRRCICRHWAMQANTRFLRRQIGNELELVLECVWLSVWKRWSSSSDPGLSKDGSLRASYAPWFGTVCRSRVIDRLRSLGAVVRKTEETIAALCQVQEIAPLVETVNPLLVACEMEEEERLASRLLEYRRTLDSTSSRIFDEVARGGSSKGIAALLSMKEAAVQKRVSRLYGKLVLFLEEPR